MHLSHHFEQRLNQRGISRRLVDFTLRHGRVEGNKHVLDRNESRRLIDALEEELRLAKRVLDKGGVTIVAGGDTLVTAYNLTAARGQRRRHHGGPSHD
jgi:hypothetical protein